MLMPNTPRDPDKELRQKREQDMLKKFLQNGGGPGYGMPGHAEIPAIPPSQNPFATPVPSADHMAMMNGAVMNSKIPKSPVPEMSDDPTASTEDDLFKDPFQDVIPQNKEFDSGISDIYHDTPEPGSLAPQPNATNPNKGQDERPSDISDSLQKPWDKPEMGPVPPPVAKAMPDAVQAAEPGNPTREMLMNLLKRSLPGNPQSFDQNNALSDSQLATNKQNGDLSVMRAMFQAANMAGSINGKVASSAPIEGVTDAGIQSNDQRQKQIENAALGRAGDRSKLLSTLQALAQNDENNKYKDKQLASNETLKREGFDIQKQGFANQSADRNALVGATLNRDTMANEIARQNLDFKKNPVARPMNELDKANAKLANAKAAAEQYSVDHPETAKAGKPTPQTAADKDFGKNYNEWTSGKRENLVQSINDLQDMEDELVASHGGSANALKGKLPGGITAAFGDKDPDREARVRDIVSNGLKSKFGARPAQQEVIQAQNRAFDRGFGDLSNADRIKKLKIELTNSLNDTDKMVEHYETNGQHVGGFDSVSGRSQIKPGKSQGGKSSTGPKGPSVIQNGHTYNWNPETGKYE